MSNVLGEFDPFRMGRMGSSARQAVFDEVQTALAHITNVMQFLDPHMTQETKLAAVRQSVTEREMPDGDENLRLEVGKERGTILNIVDWALTQPAPMDACLRVLTSRAQKMTG